MRKFASSPLRSVRRLSGLLGDRRLATILAIYRIWQCTVWWVGNERGWAPAGLRLPSANSSSDCVLHSAAEMNITTRSAPVASSVSPTRSADEHASKELADSHHYTTLSQLVAEASRDHAQLRGLIYEFARAKLRRELYPQFLDGAWSEIEHQILGLERAIVRVEADVGQTAQPLQSTSVLPGPSGGQSFSLSNPQRTSPASTIYAESLLLNAPQNASLSLYNPGPDSGKPVLGRYLRSRFWRNTQLLLAAAIGLTIYLAVDPRLILKRASLSSFVMSLQDNPKGDIEQANPGIPASEVEASKSSAFRSAKRPRALTFPIPAEYGAYVLNSGQLTELEQLPIKVPDPRVAISAAFPVPSKVHIAAGQLQFVAYRRDLANSTPDRVEVRVVAQLMRALSFDSKGHPKTAAVEQTWVVRNQSYELSVAPFADNPEMILMRSAVPDLVLPAGRYALVLKGVGYDFTVEGALTDKAHCLERTDGLDTAFYSECKKL
jgi:hypothetical protein